MSLTASTTHPEQAPRSVDDLPRLERLRTGLITLRSLHDNPGDTEIALRAATLLNAGAFPRVLALFESADEGRRVLRQRPALDCEHVDLHALAQLPEGTLGHAYSTFLTSRGLTPEVFVAPREIRDERKRYVGQRLRQTHDLWHVVTGYNTDVVGEVELQAFTYAQLRTPFAFLVASFGAFKTPTHRMQTVLRVWRAYRRGLKAAPLCFRAWEDRLATPLAEVRRELQLH